MVQHTDVILRPRSVRGAVLRDLRHGRARHLLPDDLSLRRIVVHEHHAVRTDVEIARNRGKIDALRLPVCADVHEILRPQHALRMPESCERIRLLIFGIHSQQHADRFLFLQIRLKLPVCLPQRSLLAQLNAIHAVVPDDAAPERVVQVEYQRLLVFPIDRLDDIGDAERQKRNCLHGERVLVETPERVVKPCVQSVGRRQIIDVVEIEVFVRVRIRRKPFVEPVHEAHPPAVIRSIAVSLEPPRRIFKIILNDRAMEPFREFFPHPGKPVRRAVEQGLHILPGHGHLRQLLQVPVRGVNINHVRREAVQRLIAEHSVLIVLGILRLIKLRLNSLPQQKDLHHPDDVVGCRSA